MSRSLEEIRQEVQAEKDYLLSKDAQRAERLYVSDEYKIFFVTKQPRYPLPDKDDRKAYISAKPFNELTEEAVKKLRAIAQPWDEEKSKVRIAAWERDLVLVDVPSRTESFISISRLDDSVREKLQPFGDGEATWKKFISLASGTVGQDVTAPEKASFAKSARPKALIP